MPVAKRNLNSILPKQIQWSNPFFMSKTIRVFLLVLSMVLSSCANLQPTQSNKSDQQSAKPKPKKGIKAFSALIKPDAKTDTGVFTVYKQGEDYYFSIPDSLLGREFLLISRIAALPSGYGGGFYNAGRKANEQVVRWIRKDNKIYLKTLSYNAVAADSLPIYESVRLNNYEPTVAAFNIEALTADSSGVVIKVNDLFLKDVSAISGLSSGQRTSYKVRRLDGDRSFIERISTYPLNVEVRHEMTYEATNPPSDGSANSISLRMAQSMVLLPKEPMRPRHFDPRVGWFTVSHINYGSDELKADEESFIRRWRLQPKDPDAYARGELVEPIKPIVYYLDPATPEMWRKYFKQGIQDWQKTFETAGFKNAILAKDAPTKEEDPEWDPEDVRYSTVRYVASTTRNAVGPSVSDPRSGEIIESDIIWYHNHLRSYRNRYLLETGAANPSARTLETPIEEIGEMMRMVIAHEIGHALGLPHNMMASSAYPVDSLRSGSFTQEFGIAPTIMDYARYNYVAQPGDENIRFVRQIGPYDHYAINWGYRVILQAPTPEDENPILDAWILEKANNPIYHFGSGRGGFNPRAQTEDISDNPVAASTYGLANLQEVAPNLDKWTARKGRSWDDLAELYSEMIGVWRRYTGHVVTNIGGVYEVSKMTEQDGAVFEVVSKERQKNSMAFLQRHAFATPTWLTELDYLSNFEHAGQLERIRSWQERQLNDVLDFERLQRLLEAETRMGNQTYTALEMMGDVQSGLWSELKSRSTIDAYRRNLQRAYLERLHYLMTEEQPEVPARFRAFSSRTNVDVSQSDIPALARFHLEELARDIRSALPRVRDTMTRIHLQDAQERIKTILNPK